MLPLGILASSGAKAGDFVLLETQVLGSSAASITFSGLAAYSSTYKHLQIRLTGRTSISQPYGDACIRINGDSANNYARHQLEGQGSSVASGSDTGQNSMRFIVQVQGNTAPSGAFGAAVIDILDPFSTTKNKTLKLITGRAGSAPWIGLHSGLWMSTSSMTSLELSAVLGTGGASWITGSRFSLYGIKG